MKTAVIDFLTQLQSNNNRDWFQKNKKMYEESKREVESFVGSVIPEIAKFDPAIKYVEAKDCMFRIYRDVRFGKDKSPYKTNIGAWITSAGRKSPGPGYYLHIQPGESFLAGGVYMPEPDQLKKIRQEIYYNVEEFKAILAEKGFKKYFKGISEMDKQKLAPRDFPKDFPDIDLLKHKHYTVDHPMTDKQITDEGLRNYLVKCFEAMQPLNRFLKRALEG
jgi:uncharacterized protein (TIGR02453 family)